MRKSYISIAVASMVASLALVGCGGSDDNGIFNTIIDTPSSNSLVRESGIAKKVVLSQIPAPLTDEEKSSIIATNSVTYDNGQGSTSAIGFTKLISAKTTNNGQTFGAVKDYNDATVTDNDGNLIICDGANGNIGGSGLDHTSILTNNGRIFAVSQFECANGAMYGYELSQDPSTGALSVVDNSMQYISQKSGFGGWVHCAGMVTPWGTHLGSEEYEPDARAFTASSYDATLGYFDAGYGESDYFNQNLKYYWNGDHTKTSPYYYGFIPEVSVNASSSTPTYTYTKHFSMGRAAWELAYVMPDEKTAYLSDDGTNVGFYMYIANTAGDLSAGSLYAAKWNQTSDEEAGSADLTWIKLGSATDAEIKSILNAGIEFSDIFDTVDPADDNTCAQGYTRINTSWGLECLAVKAGQEKAAAFLETRRYSAMLGATTEFRKEEGITYNPDHNKLYVAMSEIRKGMLDGSSNDTGGNNDIRLTENKCGAVYGLDIYDASETAVDSTNNAINSEYVVKNMYGVLRGEASSYDAGSDYEAYECSPDSIAHPDNITYLKGENLLVIGEDTDRHPNDFIWAYDVVNGKMTRILSTPYGSETTSPYWYKDINGFGYLTAVTQHPFGETSSSDPDYSLVESATNKESSFGVVGPFNFTAR
ncbi:alkaline phosphatase PhoX [Campylobacterota bacterium DY0563]